MNSQENNNNGTSELTGYESSQAIVWPKFKSSFSIKLDEEITSLGKRIEQMTISNAKWKDDMKTRCSKIKETRKEFKESEKRVREFEKTRDNVRKVAQDLIEYNRLLDKDLQEYREENIKLEAQHKISIEDMDNKWKIYEARYETLPLALARSAERVALQKAEIELMLQKYRFTEIETAIRTRREIEMKRRNSLVVHIAELYEESRLEDTRTRVAVETRKKLVAKIQQQDQTILELEKKRKEEKTALLKSVAEECSGAIFSLLTRSQKSSQPFPRFDLPALAANPTLTRPMPTFHRYNYDSISITSSVIDNLIEPANLPPMETDEYDLNQWQKSQDDDELNPNAAGCFVEQNDKALTEDPPIPSNDQTNTKPVLSVRFEAMANRKEEYDDRFEEEFEVADAITFKPGQFNFNTPKSSAQENKSKGPDSYAPKFAELRSEEEVEEQEMEEPESAYSLARRAPILKEKPRVDFTSESYLPQQQKETLRTQEDQIKLPKITNIENVRLNLSPTKPITPKSQRDDSLARYFAASSALSGIDSNWKAKSNLPANLNFSFTDSQKENTEFESVLGSEVSLQSEDFMKKFHIAFSPERRNRGEYVSSVDNNRTPHAATPQTSAAGRFQVSEQQTATPFLDLKNRDTPTSREKKKDTFFLSMF